MKKIFIIVALVAGLMVSAQVKIGGTVETINTINANSILELESTNKGLLFPRVELTGTANVAPLANHVPGMTVYNTATAGDVTPGMYTNSGAAWMRLDNVSASTPAYQNIGGGVQTMDGNGTILNTTYFIIFQGNTAGTLTTPTPVAGKTLWVRNTGLNAATVAGQSINAGKMRAFVCDGTNWYPSNQ
jgi:hypothetical protein